MNRSKEVKFFYIFTQLGFLFLVFFTPLAFGSIDLWATTVMRLTVGFITLAWILQIYLESKEEPFYLFVRSRTPLNTPLLLGFILVILNTCFSIYPYVTREWLYQFLTYCLFYQVLVYHLRTQRQLVGLVSILVIAGSLEAFFGLIRYFQGFTHLLGREVPQGMMAGTFISPTHFAVYLELIIPLAIGLTFLTRQWEKKLLLGLLVAIMGTALALSLSRGGIISLLLSLIFLSICLAIRRTDQKPVWILLALFLAILTYLSWIGIMPVIERIEKTWLGGQWDESTLIRLTFWQNSLELLKEAPLLGTGLGTFQYVFLKYAPYLGESLRAFHAESIYIELLVDTGLLGLIVFLWGIQRVFQSALTAYFSPEERSLKLLTLTALTSVLAFLFHGIVDFNLRVPANALLLTTILAILMVSLRFTTTPQRKRGKGKGGGIWNPIFRFLFSRWPILPFWVGIFLILIFISWTAKAYLAEVYFHQAQGYQKNGRWQEAFQAYEKAIRLEGGNAVYQTGLGNAYLEAGNKPVTVQGGKETEEEKEKIQENWKKALEFHARSVALNPFEPGSHLNLGWVYARLGNQTAALAEFEKAVLLYPRNPYYHRNLARYCFLQGKPECGISAYRQALLLNISQLSDVLEECLLYGKRYNLCEESVPNTPEARLQFARFLVHKNLWSEGEAEYEKVLQLTQNDPIYCEEFARFYTQRGKPLKAISLWRRLLEKDPENVSIRFQIARAYQALGRGVGVPGYGETRNNEPGEKESGKKALEEYEKIVEIKPDNIQAWRGIGEVWIQMKQPERALKAYHKALELMPRQPELYGLLAEIYVQMGNLPKAIEAYQDAIGLQPLERKYYEGLANLYHQIGKPFEVITTWNRYLDIRTDDAVARHKLALYQNQMGNWLEAVKETKVAIALDSQNVSYRRFLADLYLSKGMIYEATQQWEAIVRKNPKDPDYRLQLAALYEKLSRFDKAQEEYEAVLNLQPGNQIAQKKIKNRN
ncbi:MAG TPA: tetratricopeptide repeat protein [Candidatus Limnocylindrales bacterium]|nr:tetratricopeptide repeat protein [Candidatus Limnocylindrales bacterium]